MTAPYNIVNTTATKSSADRTFIYMLSFNVSDEDISKPFYIGAAKNLAKRFTRHKEISWHYRNYSRPIKVTVLGSVADIDVDESLKDLKKTLVKQGFMFFPENLNKGRAERYLKNGNAEVYDLDEWNVKFKVKTTQAVTKPNKNKEAAVKISIQNLVDFVNSNTNLETEVLNVGLRISRSYISEEGCAKIIFDNIKNKQDAVKMQKILNQLRFMWTPQHKMKPYSVNEYRLTKPVIKLMEEKMAAD